MRPPTERSGAAAETIYQNTRELVEELNEEYVESQDSDTDSLKRCVAQIRTRLPNVSIVIGLWNFTGEIRGLLDRLGRPNLDQPTSEGLAPHEHEAIALR